MLRTLIQPTNGLLDLIEAQHLDFDEDGSDQMHLDANPFIISIHLRFGGIQGDNKAIRATSDDTLTILSCAWNMTFSWIKQQEIMVNNTSRIGSPRHHAVRWYLVSDNIELLQKISREYITGKNMHGHHLHLVVPKGGYIKHIVRNKNGEDGFMRMWLDIFLLSESHACVYARSGFPQFGCRLSERRARHRGQYNEFTSQVDKGKFLKIAKPLQCDNWVLPLAAQPVEPETMHRSRRSRKSS